MRHNGPDTSCIVVVSVSKLLIFFASLLDCRFAFYQLSQYGDLTLDGLVFLEDTIEGPDLVDVICQRGLGVL
jgi:hypothetical protein